MGYRSLNLIRHVLPDDRLANVRIDPDGVIVTEYRYGHIHPAFVAELNWLSKQIADTGVYDLDPARIGQTDGEPSVIAWMAPGLMSEILDMHVVTVPGMPTGLEVRLRADHVDPALVREINDYVYPVISGVLVPASPAGGVHVRNDAVA